MGDHDVGEGGKESHVRTMALELKIVECKGKVAGSVSCAACSLIPAQAG